MITRRARLITDERLQLYHHYTAIVMSAIGKTDFSVHTEESLFVLLATAIMMALPPTDRENVNCRICIFTLNRYGSY